MKYVYKVKPDPVDAVQFDPEVHTKAPEAKEGEAPKEALIKQAKGDGDPYFLPTKSQPLFLKPGDWILSRDGVAFGVVPAAEFAENFEPVEVTVPE